MRNLGFVLLLLFVTSKAHTDSLYGKSVAKKYYNVDRLNIRQKSLNYLDFSADEVDAFNVSEKWPECKDVFEDIQVQGNCSSSWAISVATSIRDRRCIKFGIKDPISAYDLISCCSDCQLDGQNGCNGGDHHSAFQYFINTGIVTGRAFQTDEGCKPYPIRPNSKANIDIDCEKITAYYDGKFQSPTDISNEFNAKIKVMGDINSRDKRVYFKFDNIAKEYTSGYRFNLWNETDSAFCNTDQPGECSISFKELNRFWVYFWPFNNNHYRPDLMYVKPLFNGKFQLQNAIGNCANSLKNDDPSNKDPSLYKSCFCCGDTYNPHPSLNCPVELKE